MGLKKLKTKLLVAAIMASTSVGVMAAEGDPFYEPLIVAAKDGFAEYKVAVLAIGAVLLVAAIGKNTIISILGMLRNIGRS